MKRVALVALFLLGACSSTQEAVKPVDARPHWVLSPERPGYISVVGFAPRQQIGGDEAQYKIAVMKARQELAQTVRVSVQNTLTHSMQEAGGKTASEAASSTRLSSSSAIRMERAEVTAQWRDPADGMLYLLLEIPERMPESASK